MFYKKIGIPMYRDNVHLFKTDNVLGVNKKLAGILKANVKMFTPDGTVVNDESMEAYDGMVTRVSNQDIVLWLTDKTDPVDDFDTIAHEVNHVVTNILIDRGLPLTYDSQEAYAYMQGWLCKVVVDALMGEQRK